MIKNWGIFKIVERNHWKQQNPKYIYFDLNIWFWFANGKSNTICCANQEPFKDWKVGDVIRVDLNWLIQKNIGRDDCTIGSTEIAQLVDENEFSRVQARSSFTGGFSSQPQSPNFNSSNLPPVWAVETGNYQWGTENNEEFQAVVQQQHFPPKKKQ